MLGGIRDFRGSYDADAVDSWDVDRFPSSDIAGYCDVALGAIRGTSGIWRGGYVVTDGSAHV